MRSPSATAASSESARPKPSTSPSATSSSPSRKFSARRAFLQQPGDPFAFAVEEVLREAAPPREFASDLLALVREFRAVVALVVE